MALPIGLAGSELVMPFGLTPWLLVLLLVWSLVWKGLALWKSARNGQRIWYVVLLLVNSIGLLEILYLTLWQCKCDEKPARKQKKARKKRRR
jgi:methionyl-tRNA synthetase